MTRRVLVLVVAAVSVAAAPGTASAASGTSVLTLKGPAATSLSKSKVKVSAVAPARAKGKSITFPVKTVTVGATASLGHSGAIRFKKGSRALTLKAPALRLAGRGSRLTAKVGSTTTTILTVDATKRSLNRTAGAVALKGATVRLTAAGARAIARVLEVQAVKAGTLGTLTVDATRGGTGPAGSGGSGTGTSGGSGTPGGSGSTGGGSTGGGATGTGGSGGAGAGGSGGTGGGTPKSCTSGPVATPSGGPSALTAPATSLPVAAGSIIWRVRDSFIQYINAGEGTAVANGATAEPATVQPGSSAALTYAFHFPFSGGWYDPATGAARLTYSGTVLFCYFDHGIKLTASNPEVEITASGSRAIFVTGNVDTPDQRGVLVNLENVARADSGTTHTWSQMPGRIPADAGDSTFAGYYAAGDPFGWITVSATTS